MCALLRAVSTQNTLSAHNFAFHPLVDQMPSSHNQRKNGTTMLQPKQWIFILFEFVGMSMECCCCCCVVLFSRKFKEKVHFHSDLHSFFSWAPNSTIWRAHIFPLTAPIELFYLHCWVAEFEKFRINKQIKKATAVWQNFPTCVKFQTISHQKKNHRIWERRQRATKANEHVPQSLKHDIQISRINSNGTFWIGKER